MNTIPELLNALDTDSLTFREPIIVRPKSGAATHIVGIILRGEEAYIETATKVIKDEEASAEIFVAVHSRINQIVKRIKG